MQNLIVASAEAAKETSPGLFEALGLDAKLLVEQTIAFLILVAILAKFVYPALIKAIDSRRDQIEAGMKEAKQAEEALATAEEKVADLLAVARKEADEIIARSHTEATTMVSEAEDRAKARAEQIVADARTQLDNDVRKAREALKSETIKLVALATEKVINEKLDDKKDATLIQGALNQEKA
jgi:F-type H+-transporting ATPase subunit b